MRPAAWRALHLWLNVHYCRVHACPAESPCDELNKGSTKTPGTAVKVTWTEGDGPRMRAALDNTCDSRSRQDVDTILQHRMCVVRDGQRWRCLASFGLAA